jgi:hypothetical protein
MFSYFMCAYHMYIVLKFNIKFIFMFSYFMCAYIVFKFNNKYSLLCFYISCVLMIDRAKRESNVHVITLIIHS